MKKLYDRPLTAAELAALPEDSIDYSDIPELDDEFWANADLRAPAKKQVVSLRLDTETIEAFKVLAALVIILPFAEHFSKP